MMNTTQDTEFTDAISILHSSETLKYPEDDEDVKQIFDNIYHEILQVVNEMKKVLRKCTVQPSFMTVNYEKTVVLRELEALLENKTKTISGLTEAINKSLDYEFPRFKADAVLSIPMKLEEHVTDCEELLKQLENNNDNDEKYLDFLTKSKLFLEKMQKSLNDSEPNSEELSKIETEVGKEYIECKRDMKTLMEMLYPEQVVTIIGEIMEKSLSNEDDEDKWYEITDPSVYTTVATLINTNVLECNPHNKRQVKMNSN